MLDHLEPDFGLVHWHHVSCFVDDVEEKVFEGFELSMGVKFVVFGSEFLLGLPGEVVDQVLAAFPVANVIFVSIVDQNRKVFVGQFGQLFLCVD